MARGGQGGFVGEMEPKKTRPKTRCQQPAPHLPGPRSRWLPSLSRVCPSLLGPSPAMASPGVTRPSRLQPEPIAARLD